MRRLKTGVALGMGLAALVGVPMAQADPVTIEEGSGRDEASTTACATWETPTDTGRVIVNVCGTTKGGVAKQVIVARAECVGTGEEEDCTTDSRADFHPDAGEVVIDYDAGTATIAGSLGEEPDPEVPDDPGTLCPFDVTISVTEAAVESSDGQALPYADLLADGAEVGSYTSYESSRSNGTASGTACDYETEGTGLGEMRQSGFDEEYTSVRVTG